MTLTAFGSAGATTGAPGSGAAPTSAAPDLLTATITRAPAPTSPLSAQVRYCFDEVINAASIGAVAFNVSNYDSAPRPYSSSATIDTQDPKCVIASFGNGLDIAQSTVATVDNGGVANNAGTINPFEGVPLTGSIVTPVAGSTTAPDLVSAEAQPGAVPPTITYTFDENLDPGLAGGGAALAGKFGFYVDTDDGACAAAPCAATFGRRGSTITGVDGKTIVVTFTAAQSVNQAKLFFYDPLGAGASVQDRSTGNILGPPNTLSPIGSTGAAITGGPSLVSAAKQPSNQVVNLTFAQNVIPGVVGAAAPGGNVVAYRADANTIGGTYAIGTAGSDLKTLPLTMPSTTQRDPGSVVRIAIRPGLVRNNANDRSNAFGAVSMATEPSQIGFTDGPDLLTTAIDDTDNRVTYNFDEALHSAPDPTGTEFRVINADGSTQTGQAGTAVVSADRKSVSVKFGGSVSGSSVAGVANTLFAVFDAVDDNPAAGNGSPAGSVSTILIPSDDCGTSCPTPTPTTTVPTATPTPAATTKNVKSTVSIKRKKKGKKFSGKVSAAAPCKAGRTVTVAGKSAKTKSNGSYSVSFGKKKKGKVSASVSARSIKQGTTTFKCGSAKSPKV